MQKRDPNTGRLLHDPWEWWHAFRTLCEHHSQLCVALDLRCTLAPWHLQSRVRIRMTG